VAEKPEQIRILAVAAAETKEKLRARLTSFGMHAVLVSRAAELAHHTRNGEIYQVALLPATLPSSDEWWSVWGDLAMLCPQPAILVYAQTATFQLWSGVLEAGGYDVIVEPLTEEKLKEAVQRAAQSFAHRSPDGAGQE
jgi:hypothetical protein